MQESGSISGAGGAAFDFAFFHQAVIVVHHQVAFNLCERVEHIFLGIVAILPAFARLFGVSQNFAQFFGGTSLLILVGVVLDTLTQVERIRLHQNPFTSEKVAKKPLPCPSALKPESDRGMNMMAWAKMMGMTPAAFTLRGMYWRAPPYWRLPTIRLAYCTGTLRVPWTRSTAPTVTEKSRVSCSSRALHI